MRGETSRNLFCPARVVILEEIASIRSEMPYAGRVAAWLYVRLGLLSHRAETEYHGAMKPTMLAAIALALAILLPQTGAAFPVDFGQGFVTHRLSVAGDVVSLTVGGHGPVVVLLHGYAEDSRMWRPLAMALAPRFTVVAPDLPGIGNSSIPSAGSDMKTAAQRVHDAVRRLGFRQVYVVGHDIGLMVAYAYAAMYPHEVGRLALMDAFLPGIAGWEPIYNNPNLWHFRFHGRAPLALVAGRERIYFDYYWNEFAADPNRSLSQVDRSQYTAAYSRPGRMAAGWAYFESFPRTAVDFAQLGATKLKIPVLSIGGDKSLGVQLAAQARLISDDVTVVVLKNTGHWLMEESPNETIANLTKFVERP
jgi:pimeloyl-ACP methyl ester carboxylesterase